MCVHIPHQLARVDGYSRQYRFSPVSAVFFIIWLSKVGSMVNSLSLRSTWAGIYTGEWQSEVEVLVAGLAGPWEKKEMAER